MSSTDPELGTKWTEQKWETGNKREKENKNNKGMHPSLWYFPLLYKIPPSFIPGPAPFNLSSCHWSAQPPPQSHKLPAEPIQGERGSQHQPPGTKEVGDDPVSPLDSRRAHTLISSDCLCLLCLSGHIMSSSSTNIHNKRLPCKFFSKPSHLLQTAVLYFNSFRMRNSHRIHFAVLDVE